MKPSSRIAYIIVMIGVLLTATICEANAGGVGLVLKGAGKLASKNCVKQAAKAGGKSLSKIPPHIQSQVLRNFGNSGAKILEKAPISDTIRLVEYAGRAGSKQVRNTLLTYYQKGGTQFLDRLSWDKILAIGLSTSMIVGAYQTSDGIQTGMQNVSKSSPEIFGNTVNHMIKWITSPFVLSSGILLVGFALIRLGFYYKKKKRKWEASISN